ARGAVELPELDPRPGREDRDDVGAWGARVAEPVVVAVGLRGVRIREAVVEQVAHAVPVAVRSPHVGGARRARPAALLGGIADTRRGPADGARGLERVRRAGHGGAVAGLGHVTVARGRAADGTHGPVRVGRAAVVHPVAALGHVAHTGRRAAHRRALGVGRTGGTRPVAALGHVADAGGGAALEGRGLEGVGRAVVAHYVAA